MDEFIITSKTNRTRIDILLILVENIMELLAYCMYVQHLKAIQSIQCEYMRQLFISPKDFRLCSVFCFMNWLVWLSIFIWGFLFDFWFYELSNYRKYSVTLVGEMEFKCSVLCKPIFNRYTNTRNNQNFFSFSLCFEFKVKLKGIRRKMY